MLPIMVLFWLENIVFGVLNILRILLASPADVASRAGKLVLIPFFILHYGLFTAGHGVFVFTLFGGAAYTALVQGLWTLDAARYAIKKLRCGRESARSPPATCSHSSGTISASVSIGRPSRGS